MAFEKRYENGLRLVVNEMTGLMSVTMGILVGTGANVETDAEDGISHFIEHMQFKGKVENMTSRSMLIWDNNPETMKAYTTKIPMK